MSGKQPSKVLTLMVDWFDCLTASRARVRHKRRLCKTILPEFDTLKKSTSRLEGSISRSAVKCRPLEISTVYSLRQSLAMTPSPGLGTSSARGLAAASIALHTAAYLQRVKHPEKRQSMRALSTQLPPKWQYKRSMIVSILDTRNLHEHLIISSSPCTSLVSTVLPAPECQASQASLLARYCHPFPSLSTACPCPE